MLENYEIVTNKKSLEAQLKEKNDNNQKHADKPKRIGKRKNRDKGPGSMPGAPNA